MANRHSTRSARTLAVGYLRRSTRNQDRSIPEQRNDIEEYAKLNGYSIVRWYIDDGISGDDGNRPEFCRMASDAINIRDFEAIICWHSDRFSRKTAQATCAALYPLYEAGLKLVTTKDGILDYDNFTNFLTFSINQNASHQFLHDLSRNTARGQIAIAKRGHLTGQAAPYGYDRMYIDDAGEHRGRAPRGEIDQVGKRRSWHVTLVPSENPGEVETLKWLFKTYAETTIGLRPLALELNNRGVPSPNGGKWCLGTIRDILKNEKYVGDFVWGKRRMGKYNWIKNGEITPRDKSEIANDRGKTIVNDREDCIVHENAWEPLIDRKLFDRVQRKMEKNRLDTSGATAKNRNVYLLSGLVRCGHCGGPMHGQNNSRTKKSGKKYDYFRYCCSTQHKNGSCERNGIDAVKLAKVAIDLIRRLIMAGNSKEDLANEIRKRLKQRKNATPAQADALREQLAKLTTKFERGTKRLYDADDDLYTVLAEQHASMKRQIDGIKRELAALDAAPGIEADDEAEAIADRLWHLAESLTDDDAERVKQLLRETIVGVRLFFTHERKNDRTFSQFSKETLELSPQLRGGLELSRLVSRGERI